MGGKQPSGPNHKNGQNQKKTSLTGGKTPLKMPVDTNVEFGKMTNDLSNRKQAMAAYGDMSTRALMEDRMQIIDGRKAKK